MKALVLELADLHLGYLGCYGNEWVATPALDRFAAQGVVFDQHFAGWLGAGREPWTGRYDVGDGDARFTAGQGPDLTQLLADRGIPVYRVRRAEASAAGGGL